MDSSGIHLLVRTGDRLDGRLATVCPGGPVRRVIEIAGVAEQLGLVGA